MSGESTIVSFETMARLVGFMVVLELDNSAEERCGGEEAFQQWTTEHDGDADALRLFSCVACLSASALAALTITKEAHE